MNEVRSVIQLCLARPATPVTEVHASIRELTGFNDVYALYPLVSGVYLQELVESPEMEVRYDEGVEVWVESVLAVHNELGRIFGTTTALVYQFTGTWMQRVSRRIMGRPVPSAWQIDDSYKPDPGTIRSMTAWEWPRILWTSLPADTVIQSRLSGSSLFEQGRVQWWMTHGPEEPYLLFWVNGMAGEELHDLIARVVRAPVERSSQSFMSLVARIRAHT